MKPTNEYGNLYKGKKEPSDVGKGILERIAEAGVKPIKLSEITYEELMRTLKDWTHGK